MVRTIDDRSAVAAFRQGRSLCIRLHGVLDARLSGAAAAVIRQDSTAVRVRLECSTLTVADREAAALLGDALLAWVAAADGRVVDLHNLDPAIEESAAWGPLRSFRDPDEAVFFDPTREPRWTATVSRH